MLLRMSLFLCLRHKCEHSYAYAYVYVYVTSMNQPLEVANGLQKIKVSQNFS